MFLDHPADIYLAIIGGALALWQGYVLAWSLAAARSNPGARITVGVLPGILVVILAVIVAAT